MGGADGGRAIAEARRDWGSRFAANGALDRQQLHAKSPDDVEEHVAPWNWDLHFVLDGEFYETQLAINDCVTQLPTDCTQATTTSPSMARCPPAPCCPLTPWVHDAAKASSLQCACVL